MTKSLYTKAFIIATLLYLSSNTQAQEPDKYYKKAVESFEKAEYRKADSLFTLSVKALPNRDNYFNRAMARIKIGNTKGSCEDLAQAAKYGDKEAVNFFCKNCGKVDTTYFTQDEKPATKHDYYFKNAEFSSAYVPTFTIQTDKFNNNFPVKQLNPGTVQQAQVYEGHLEQQAEYPGGIREMIQFLQKNIKVPKQAKDYPGKVYAKFVVNEDGTVSNVEILKGIAGCTECDAEAVRVIKLMPAWQPAKMDGKVVKCYFNLPISFR